MILRPLPAGVRAAVFCRQQTEINMGVWIKQVCFVILASATMLSVLQVDQYESAGDQMLVDTEWQTRAGRKGLACFKDGRAFLSSGEGGKNTSVYQNVVISAGLEKVLVTARIRTEGVQQGKKRWERARLVFFQYDKKGKHLKLSHHVVGLIGSHDWEYYEKAFDLHPDAKAGRVVAQLLRCSGKMEAEDVSLYPVQLSSGYQWCQYFVPICWGVFLLAVVVGMAREMERRSVSVLLCSFAAILFATLIPGWLKAQIYNIIAAYVVKLTAATGKSGIYALIGEWGHFLFFLFFGAAAGRLMPKTPALQICLNILILAGGTEMAQCYIDGRTATVFDFLVDTAGGVAGLLAARALARPDIASG